VTSRSSLASRQNRLILLINQNVVAMLFFSAFANVQVSVAHVRIYIRHEMFPNSQALVSSVRANSNRPAGT
jgi:hypothetical protein